MKLSELLKIKEKLVGIDTDTHAVVDTAVLSGLNEIIGGIRGIPLSLTAELGDLVVKKEQIVNEIYDQLLSHLNRKISAWYPAYDQKSEEFHSAHDKLDASQWAEYHTLIYGNSKELNDYVSARIQTHTTWQHAAMLYQFDDVSGLFDLFSFYPTYVVDKWKENIARIQEHITAEQYRKVRFYDQDILDRFPRVMQLVVSRNHFTHTCHRVFKEEMDWITRQVLPGGLIAFNFNDCSRPKCAELFEQGFRSFMTLGHVSAYFEAKGWKITHVNHLDENRSTWVEVQRPGCVALSLKRGETLGKIINKQYI